MTTMNYYEELSRNRGEAPKPITEQRFWEMLGALPPAKWERRNNSESFMVIEGQTDDLYTFCARIGDNYYEMILPRNTTHGEILNRIAEQLEKETP